MRSKDEIIEYVGICIKCGTSFTIQRPRRNLYGKNIPKHCSRSCANSRIHSIDIINKIKNTFSLKPKNIKAIKKIKNIKVDKYCLECGNIINGKFAKKFCSNKCSSKNIHNRTNELIISKLNNNIQLDGHNAVSIKKALIVIKKHQCSICNLTEWLGEPIPLVMDHIDGRASNNSLDNLRLVCGNCDMKLPTYKSKNKNSDRRNRK